MTQEQYDRIKHLEPYFKTCVLAQYKRATTKKDNDLVYNILKELKLYAEPNDGCAKCVYSNYLRLGKEYFGFAQEKKTASKTTNKVKKSANGKKG